MTKLHVEPAATEAVTLPSLGVIECLASDQLIDVGNNEFTATIGARPDISRNGLPIDDPNCQPSQAGDVLSVQPDGKRQARPAGTTGAYERCAKTGAGAVYRPMGKDGRTFIVPLAPDAPNK